MKNLKRLISLLLALAMCFALAACGSSSDDTSSDTSSDTSTSDDSSDAEDTTGVATEDQVAEASSGDVDNGDGSYYNEELGYTYGTTFYSDEPVTYTMYFNDNDAYPYLDSWYEDGGIFYEIEQATNVHLEITIVNNASYSDRVSLGVSSGDAPYIIPKIYDESTYVTGGGIVAVSDYTQYMPNFTNFYNEYDMEDDVNTILQDDGKFYRLPGMKETALQDYTLLLRKDYFEGAGYSIEDLEADWTWEEFADILIDVKAYMVEQGIVDEDDYIWSDRWCGATSGYSSGGCLLNLISHSYGICTSWSTTASNLADLYFDTEADEFKVSSTSDAYKRYMTVVQKLVDNKILDPETWSQEDTTADSQFYTGKTALILTNRSQITVQEASLEAQVGAGNYELYMAVMPMGTDDDGNAITYQTENSRLECGIMISNNALNELGEDGFIKMMRFVDWLWYSDAGLTLTKWGIEGETYVVNDDGTYSLTDGYYCGGLSIAQTSDDQVDMRLQYGWACGNFMYSGTTELLTSNYSAELQDYYSRMAEYRTLKPLNPAIALSEDDSEAANLYATPAFSEMNTWTLNFAMGKKDIEDDWDEYVAAIEAQNVQYLVDLYNEYYQASK
ncbi:MAG: hypothetical protein LIO45_08245 [Clostridiales bacterium]|nr:hypothetical protein [Clostridiales bacterium]